MALTVCTFDGLNLNDHVTYWLMQGFDPGDEPLSFDVFTKYTGGVSVRNVNRAGVVQLTLPLDIRASSEAALRAGLAALNAKIAGCSYASPKTLTHRSSSYQIVDSVQVKEPADELWAAGIARLSVVLNRLSA